jgi:hypothetical protein
MIIYHYTPKRFIKSILESETLWLEAENTRRTAVNMSVPPMERARHQQSWKQLRFGFKKTGRYVWFTEVEEPPFTMSHTNEEILRLSFDTNDFIVKSWKDVYRSKKGVARKMLDALNQGSRVEGDDPDLWWVSTKEIPLKHMIDEIQVFSPRDNLTNTQKSQKTMKRREDFIGN